MNLDIARPEEKNVRTYVGSCLVKRSVQECSKHGLNPNGNAPGTVADLDDDLIVSYAQAEAKQSRVLFGF